MAPLIFIPSRDRIEVRRRIGGWWVHARLREKRGRLIVYYLEVWPDGDSSPPGGLTARDLNELRLPEAVAEASRFLAQEGAFFHRMTRQARQRMKVAGAKHQGRARDQEFYARVALDYLAELKSNPLRPVAALSEKYRSGGRGTWAGGHVGAKAASVRDWVHRARLYGWLEPFPAHQGTAEGWASDKLKTWRKSAEAEEGKHGAHRKARS